MNRQRDIPIQIMRTIVAIAETGSLTRAAQSIGLSQPAVSAQMKRIERAIGGILFSKTPNGSIVTDLGQIVLIQARKLLDAHDQIFSLGGAPDPEIIRLGLSPLLVRGFMQSQNTTSLANIHIRSENSGAIGRALLGGHIDIACFFELAGLVHEWQPLIVNELDDRLVWVRSHGFVLSPGAPLPIVTGSGDDWFIRALTRAGIPYVIVYNGEDYDARRSALEAGVGMSALPSKFIPTPLRWAKEYYLPALPAIKTMLCIRKGVESDRANRLQKALISLFFSDVNTPNGA